MKRLFISILIICSHTYVYSQDIIKLKDPVFKVGEELDYKLRYGFLTAATAVLHVEESEKKFDGHPVYHIVADGKTAGTFDFFYKVRNQYESYIDQKTLLPYFYTESRHEASYKHSDDVVFNHSDEKITAAKGVFPFKGKVFDFLSAYYFSRSIDVSKINHQK